jgi:hypothetical protein
LLFVFYDGARGHLVAGPRELHHSQWVALRHLNAHLPRTDGELLLQFLLRVQVRQQQIIELLQDADLILVL